MIAVVLWFTFWLVVANLAKAAELAPRFQQSMLDTVRAVSARFGVESQPTWATLRESLLAQIGPQTLVAYALGLVMSTASVLVVGVLYVAFLLIEMSTTERKLDPDLRRSQGRRAGAEDRDAHQRPRRRVPGAQDLRLHHHGPRELDGHGLGGPRTGGVPRRDHRARELRALHRLGPERGRPRGARAAPVRAVTRAHAARRPPHRRPVRDRQHRGPGPDGQFAESQSARHRGQPGGLGRALGRARRLPGGAAHRLHRHGARRVPGHATDRDPALQVGPRGRRGGPLRARVTGRCVPLSTSLRISSHVTRGRGRGANRV